MMGSQFTECFQAQQKSVALIGLRQKAYNFMTVPSTQNTALVRLFDMPWELLVYFDGKWNIVYCIQQANDVAQK